MRAIIPSLYTGLQLDFQNFSKVQYKDTTIDHIPPSIGENDSNDQENDDQNQLLKIVKDITSKGFVRNNYKKNLVDLSDVKISLKGKK